MLDQQWEPLSLNADFAYLDNYARSSAQQAQFCLLIDQASYRAHKDGFDAFLSQNPCEILFAKGFDQNSVSDLRALVKLAHAHEIAILVVDSVDLALEAGANGAHLTRLGEKMCASSSLSQWRERLDKDFILGGMIAPNRHDAMVMGEAGADYLGLGSIDQPFEEEALAPLIELAQWLHELSKLAITVFGAHTPSHIEKIIKAGASHIVVPMDLWKQIHVTALKSVSTS